MIFNSLAFLVFFPVFAVGYFGTRGRARLWLCLGGSYLFYGWWDWRFLALILGSTVVDFLVGAALERSEDPLRRKRLLIVSLVANLGSLGFFKYFNFFTSSFVAASRQLGFDPSWTTLEIILPVGISFYTFQSLSYSIDIYRRQLRAEPDFVRFATFVAFFPQLVAGPIVRASELLPQLRKDHQFDAARTTSGLQLVIWGFFKKVCVADSLAIVVDRSFATPLNYQSLSLILAVLFYAFQIYCDFSGYSDIAIGLARILGFDFPDNFRRPYFSRSFSEFWTRWHVSLSSWLRDYLYIPLGGNRGGSWGTYRNLSLTMLLGGLWHGANWTFIVWGALHGGYLVAQRLLEQPLRTAADTMRLPPWLRSALLILLVFALTCLAWVFFRARSLADAWAFLDRIGDLSGMRMGAVKHRFAVTKGLALISILLAFDVASGRPALMAAFAPRPVLRGIGMAVLVLMIFALGSFEQTQFIYFQF